MNFEEEDQRFISSAQSLADVEIDNKLRPLTMEEYVGQDKVKQNLGVFIRAAKERKESLDHVLLYGPPGLGKTTLAHIIANEMGVQFRVTSGPAIERAGDLAAILTNLNEGDVLFVDEIHRLNSSVEEILYPAMEDYCLDFVIGKGPAARSMRLALPHFTLIGATTKAGSLSSPLRDRFGVMARLEMYAPEELGRIILRSADILFIRILPDAIEELAKRSRGTPRIANRLLKRVRDFAQVLGEGTATREITMRALDMLEVDELGLDNTDRTVLDAILTKFGGGPVGLDTLAASTNEEKSTIEDVIEPYLLQLGFLARTARGRVATEAAYKHFGYAVPRDKRQISLFDESADENK